MNLRSHLLYARYYLSKVLLQRTEFNKTKSMEGTKKGQSCFVFANGPSMNLLDTEKVLQYQKNGMDVFCVNSYIISDIADTVVPDYYVLSDERFFTNTETIIPANQIIHKLYHADIPVFVPATFLKSIHLTNKYIFNDFGEYPSYNINPLKPRGYVSMTAYKALAIACFMGYSPIYICGFDNDQFKSISVDEHNEMWFEYAHYYDKIPMKQKASQFFTHGSLANYLLDCSRLFKSLELFKNYYIVNLNTRGLIDVFTKQHVLDIYRENQC